MNLKSWIALGLIVSLSAFAANKIYFTSKASSEITLFKNENGQFSVQTKEPKFFVVTRYNESAGIYPVAVVEALMTNGYSYFSEGVQGEVSIRVRGGDQMKSTLWQMKENANNVTYEEEIDSVITSLSGCCSAVDTHRAYDATTGKLLISYSEVPESRFASRKTPYLIEVPNSQLPKRMIGVITQDATRDTDFETPTTGKFAAALIKYTSKGGSFQKLQVDVPAAENYGISVSTKLMTFGNYAKMPEIMDGKATLWNADAASNPSSIEGVALELTISAGLGDQTVVIPVKADQLDVASALVAPGVVIRKLR